MKDQLFLMEPGFVNGGLGPFYCGDSVSVEGLLSFFPQLRDAVDVHYVAFPRPRQAIVDLVGSNNQCIPVLVLVDDTGAPADIDYSTANGRNFISEEKEIRKFLSTKFGLPQAG